MVTIVPSSNGSTTTDSDHEPQRISGHLRATETAWLTGAHLPAPQSERLLTGGLFVRVQPGELKKPCNTGCQAGDYDPQHPAETRSGRFAVGRSGYH